MAMNFHKYDFVPLAADSMSLQDGIDAMSMPVASQNCMAISKAVNQFYPSKDIRSEYRATMCQKPKPKRMGEGPVRFGGVDRGNIQDSYNLVRALRTDGGGGVSRREFSSTVLE